MELYIFTQNEKEGHQKQIIFINFWRIWLTKVFASYIFTQSKIQNMIK